MFPNAARQTLNPVQHEALAMICAGSTISAAAKELGVHRNTISNWLATPPFRQALDRAMLDQAVVWRDASQQYVLEAFTAIHRILADPRNSASVRLKAAQFIIERGTAPLPAIPKESAYLNPYPYDGAAHGAPRAPGPSPEEIMDGIEQGTKLCEMMHECTILHNSDPEIPSEEPEPSAAEPSMAADPPQSAPKTGRNEPCPCGSGKKFKRCCLCRTENESISPTDAQSPDVPHPNCGRG